MIEATRDESKEGFAHSRVPEDATGSASKVFFIIVGTLCGLPGFVLAAQVAASLGLRAAGYAFFGGGAISAILGALSSFTGARTRMSLAQLAEATFGTRGAQVVQLAISIAAIGWFAVTVSILGATIGSTIGQVYGLSIPTPAIAIPLCVLITFVARDGVNSMHKLGVVIVPLTFVLLTVAIVRTLGSSATIAFRSGSAAIDFGSAISAVVGEYIVGIIIQPDYGRFVRRPGRAALAVASALGLAYPSILFLSSLPALASSKPDLITALIVLGLGIPALALLLLGAWIDASSCLYSGSLALAKLLPGPRFRDIMIGATVVSVLLALLHVERYFIPFLLVLGVSLPPLAAVQCTNALWSLAPGAAAEPSRSRQVNAPPFVAWGIGIVAGFTSHLSSWTTTGLPAVDSIIASVVAMAAMRFMVGRHRASIRASMERPSPRR